MPTDEKEICREIANLHDNIFAAGVIQNQQLVARYTKVKERSVGEEALKLMFAQPEIVLNVCRTGEEYFGRLQYLIVCHENSDLLFFPAIVDGNDRIFYIRMKRSFRGEEVLEKVYEYLEKRKP